MLGALQDAWFLAVNHLAATTPSLHAPVRLFADDGVALFALILLANWWWARRTTRPSSAGGAPDPSADAALTAALWAPLATLLALAVNQPLVGSFAEARPYTVFPHAFTLVAHSTDYSFPSDHGVMAGAVAAGVL